MTPPSPPTPTPPRPQRTSSFPSSPLSTPPLPPSRSSTPAGFNLASVSRPVPPSSTARRSFLGKLPLPRVLPVSVPRLRVSTPRLIPARFSRSQFYARNSTPKSSESPLATLVVRVLGARDLVKGKDDVVLGVPPDPYVIIRYGQKRVTSSVVVKSREPRWEMGEARLESLVWASSRAFGKEKIELVLWDKDKQYLKQYMGEVSIDWWAEREGQEEGVGLGFDDPENQPRWYPISSSRSRSRSTASGALLVQIGFLSATPSDPNSTSPNTRSLSPTERENLQAAIRRISAAKETASRPSREERVLLASPTEGVGTTLIGEPIVEPTPEDTASSSDEDEEGSEIESTSDLEFDDEEDGEDEEALGGTTTATEGSTSDSDFQNDDDQGTIMHHPDPQPEPEQEHNAAEEPLSYFDAADVTPSSPVIDNSSSATIPASAPMTPSITEPPLTPLNPIPFPSPSLSLASPLPPPPNQRRGISIPFFKRSQSHKSVKTTSGISNLEGEGSSAATSDTGELVRTEEKEKRRRFTRRKKRVQVPVIDGSGTETPVESGGMEVAPDGEGAGSAVQKRSRKKSKRKQNLKVVNEGEIEKVDKVKKEKKSKVKVKKVREGKGKGKGRGGQYEYEENDGIYGLCQIEIKGAKDLPKFKNLLNRGWDMDPVVIVAFGRKVFRTRVIRHNLNPIWDEKLFFHVRRSETAWLVTINVLDWDKLSANDRVGDIAIPLQELTKNTIQPDERGLYPATKEGKLIGDEFNEHSLEIQGVEKGNQSSGSVPTLQIRAKFTPYDALRQQFWRCYLRQYDIDESGAFSHLEVYSMLDSLGSTLSKNTISSFFTRCGKTIDQELTVDEVVLCLEQELRKPMHEKKLATGDLVHSGSATPNVGMFNNGGGDFTEDGVEVLSDADPESFTLDAIGIPSHPASMSSITSVDTSSRRASSSGETALEESAPETLVERVINIKECPLCHLSRLSTRLELDIVTHMAICSSNDPRSVNRILVGNSFVTASNASRKWFTRIVAKATNGAYSLGANSANIIVQDRRTGTLQEEKIATYVRLGIRLAYKGIGIGGGMEGARIRKLLESMSIKQGVKFDSPSSVREIEPFIAFHSLDMSEVLEPISSFKTFNEFFYRKLKPGARPVVDPEDPKTLVSPADCRAMFFPTVDDATRLWIKGRGFSIARLLGDAFKDKAALYEGGSVAIFRLAPQDFHRFSSPVDGVCGKQSKIAGQYYTVNPMAIRSSIDVYGENVRTLGVVDSPDFGEVMSIWVGAMLVASTYMTKFEGDQVKRGEEMGYFAFGGSTVVTLFPPNTVTFDSDLLVNSRHSLETLIRTGDRIGRKKGFELQGI